MLIGKTNLKFWFSLVELMISVAIVSIILIWTFKSLSNFYGVIWYIDSNINWLNMSKTAIDEIINIRNGYFTSLPYDWWESFIENYWTWTYKLSKNRCNITDDLNNIYLCKIEDIKREYEWPLNNIWELISNLTWIHFYRKVDISIENNFYLKNIDRIKTSTWEVLAFKFTDEIYNHNSMLISWKFENSNEELISSWLDINFFDIDWNASDWFLNNLNNNNLRYSKLIEYDTWTIINKWDNLSLSYSGSIYKFEFVDVLPTLTWTWVIPIKIDLDINKNYLNLCREIDKISFIDCNFNYIFKDNFYNKLIWIEKDLSEIDFWDDYTFSFSWSNNNEIRVNINWDILPSTNTDIFINPYLEIKNNKNKSNKNDFLSTLADSTSWRWIEIPNKPSLVGEINTNTWYTSLLKIKSTTFLYDWDKYIDSFFIESKIWDINRYQNYNE